MARQLRKILYSSVLGFFVFISPSYAVMYGVTNAGEAGGELVTIDLATGAGTLIGVLPETMTEAVYDVVNDRLYAQGSNGSFTLYEIDPTNGSQISVVSTTGAYNGMEFVDGTLYASIITEGGGDSDLATVDPATGIATIIGPTGYSGVTGLAYDGNSGMMYGLLGGGNAASGSLVSLNMATGAATIIGPTGFNKVGSIEFGSDGNLYGGLTQNDQTAPESLILINTATGTGTVVGNTTFSISGLAESTPGDVPVPPPVPTLSQWALILLSMLIGLMVFANRRRLF